MTLSEFKAWFEGFSEGIETAPSADQFAKIKAKVALIDRIWTTPMQPYQPYWVGPITVGDATSTSGGTSVALLASASAAIHRQAAYKASDEEWANSQAEQWFDSHAAMRELGRAEALN